ncbi:hypothetical protein LBMAG42_09990 [Deltaproteobacteria bacterium]|nr:hypothetical protein LBMAG42_09990 [Deltaproteobacteria bacterium]
MALGAALGAAVGADHVEPRGGLRDVSGRECNFSWWVRPADTAEVAAVVRVCREHRAGIAPVGSGTAYWAPLPESGAVALDLSRLEGLEWEGRVAVAGAGAAVRPLDQQLRAAGGHLALHPDAFGDTTLGAMVATACTSGIGMGVTTIGEAICGVEVVTGAGEVLFTGSAARTGVPPFLREGVPDLTGCFLGAEGGLGVVTRVALKHRPAPWRIHLRGRVLAERLGAVVGLGRALAAAYDTFRLTRSLGRWGEGYALDVWVISAFSAREAAERAVEVERRLVEAGAMVESRAAESARARAGKSPEYDARWTGPLGGLDLFTARARMRGLDVNAAYEAFDALLPAAEALVEAQRAAGVPESRLAWYLAPDFVNVGVHASVPLNADPWPAERSAPWFERFAALPVVPYRLGRSWSPSMLEGLGAGREALRALRRQLDPDGVLQPGLPLWS